jgi:hypothetical protein
MPALANFRSGAKHLAFAKGLHLKILKKKNEDLNIV